MSVSGSPIHRHVLGTTLVFAQVLFVCASLLGPAFVSAADPSDSPPPSAEPSNPPSSEPTSDPSPSAAPTAAPTEAPTPEPTPAATPALPATISSDQSDYPPGGMVRLTGENWPAGESVHLFVNDDAGSTWSRSVDVVAGAAGQISDQFNLPNWFVADYSVTATGASGAVAKTTFTDSNPNAISVGAPISVTVAPGTTAIYGTVSVSAAGNTNPCNTTLSVTAGLPTGAAAVFGTNPVQTTSNIATSSLSVTTSVSTTPGTYSFQVTGTDSPPPGGSCEGGASTGPSQVLTLVVTGKVDQSTLTITGPATATFGGADATITTSGGSGTGAITFSAGASTACSIVSGQLHVVSGTGSCSITATKAGDANFNPTTSAAFAVTINKANQATLTITAPSSATFADADATITTNGGSGAGSITFSAGPSTACSIVSGQLHVVSGTGTCSITATKAGDLDFNPTTSASFAVVVGKAASVTTVTCPTNVTYDGDPQEPCSASVTGAGGLNSPVSVTYSDNTDAGAATADATYPGDANHTGSSDTKTFTIDPASSTTVVTCPTNVTYDGTGQEPCTVQVTGAGGLDLSPDPDYADNIDAGTATASYTYDGDANHTGSSDTKTFTIDKRLATWTTISASKTYGNGDPSPLTTGSGSNFVAGDGVSATYSRAAGETVLGGPYHITANLSSTRAGALLNYTITNTGADFMINLRPATWTTNPASKTYGNGDPSPLTTGSGNFLAGDNVTATYSRAAGETVLGGPYHITANLSSSVAGALSNYAITNTGADFTINRRLASWLTNDSSKILGASDPSPLTTGSGLNFVASDGVTATYSRVAGETVAGNPYHITATLSSTTSGALDNYTITNAGADFRIYYAWDGYLQPINDTAHQTGVAESKFKLGQTIPAKFVIKTASGQIVQQATLPTFTRSVNLGSCDATTAPETTVDLQPDAGSQFFWDGSQYHYNWSTKGLTAGEYRIFANLADNTARYVDVCLTK